MKEIQEIINKKVQGMVDDGTITKKIEDSIAEAIGSAIESQFKSYGNITKQIEEALKEGLQINARDLPFETYNKQMLVLVKTKLGQMFKGAAADHFLEEMDKILDPAPKELPISEFIEKIVEFWKTDEPWDASDLDEYATVEYSDCSVVSGAKTLKMWKQKETHSGIHQCRPDLELFINKGQIRINHGHNYNPTCFDEFEAYVFKLYAAGTLLTGLDDFYPDDCDLTLKDTDY